MKLIKLVFCDGPLEGTSKWYPEDYVFNTRTHDVLIPIKQFVSSFTDEMLNVGNEASLQCKKYRYVYFKLPKPHSSGEDVYAMLLE